MTRFITLLCLLFCITLPALGQSTPETPKTSQTSNTSVTRPQVVGEIRKVDSATGKLTIRHADIPNLGMPGMTMVFSVATPALLNQATSGSQVLFTADRINGVLTVMSIEAR